MDEIEYAVQIHSRVPFTSLHQANLLWSGGERIVLSLDPPAAPETWSEELHSARRQWEEEACHDTLMRLLECGLWPEREVQHISGLEFPEWMASMFDTSERNFDLPAPRELPKDLDALPCPYEELGYVAAMILHKKCIGCWKQGHLSSALDSIKKLDSVIVDWYQDFSIPSAEEGEDPWNGQLWIVQTGKYAFRLVCVDIEPDVRAREEGEQSKASFEQRSAYLSTLGYELYSAAEWWTYVDPWRVLCTFLEHSGILDEVLLHLSGGCQSTIDSYVCAHCSEPIVRWDDDWLEELHHHSRVDTVHAECVRAHTLFLTRAEADRNEDEDVF